MCKVDPLNIVETIREGVLVREPELTGRLGYRCLGETFTGLSPAFPKKSGSPSCCAGRNESVGNSDQDRPTRPT